MLILKMCNRCLCTRYCTECLMWIISFSPDKNPMSWMICSPIFQKIKQMLSKVKTLAYDHTVSGRQSSYSNSAYRPSITLQMYSDCKEKHSCAMVVNLGGQSVWVKYGLHHFLAMKPWQVI